MAEIFIAFGAGLISFLSPCVLPLIPGYISYISGSTLENLVKSKNINLLPIILFTLGFSVVFIVFGASATFLGKILLKNSFPLRIIAGLIIIIFSLHILGVFNLNFLNYEKRLDINHSTFTFLSKINFNEKVKFYLSTNSNRSDLLYGDYIDKIAIASSFGLSYNNQSLIFINVRKISNEKDLESTIVHELIHQRFPYLSHGKRFNKLVRQGLRGKKFPPYQKRK